MTQTFIDLHQTGQQGRVQEMWLPTVLSRILQIVMSAEWEAVVVLNIDIMKKDT